jgi:hypothetical protein
MTNELTDEERYFLSYACAPADLRKLALKPGAFTSVLMEAMWQADMVNLNKLHNEFPKLVDAFLAYRDGDLVQRATQILMKEKSENG